MRCEEVLVPDRRKREKEELRAEILLWFRQKENKRARASTLGIGWLNNSSWLWGVSASLIGWLLAMCDQSR
jgi:hypothetical protein